MEIALACQPVGGIHFLMGMADNGWDSTWGRAGRAQVTVWVLQVGTAQWESPLERHRPHRPCRESQTGERQNKLECQASPTRERLHKVLGASFAWESPDVPSRSWECSPWLWCVCCSPCRGGMGTGAAQGIGSSPGSLWHRPWLALLLLLRLCLAPAWLWFKFSSLSPVSVRMQSQ